ncbi:hypothetical protein CDQ92_15065 [Sphingopyxis bauzanensis]|uniref:GmrSD restriction endonucleases N-terminal domain-containing protein n=1 Tax=Sphingopyxis bauzanensis TaxID=651663 RepID=A0A246JSQ5_9SPHN|nr:DUF262 domain-containing protein [Sphingopyxis bauzanensis]OWQ96047.1 hypothetical protein CDQ92_15065 [Sphingopyxis bauzanensis]GGJ52598.1 hypothetical protein GCM10011393_23550 [Sphingopyxis bauzanensis]
MPSIPQTFSISDFLTWDRQQQLELQPKFQRGSVWTPQAQSFLIDTILRELPIPAVYIRTRVDAATQASIREVVDGQQRLTAILAFAANRLRMTSRSPEFAGMRYNDLSQNQKDQFLSYNISTVQLLNASDADVLEVFARLNSYSVKVTPAELRHAKHDEPVKWAIWNTTREYGVLWDHFHVVSVRDSVRLKNTTLIAELYMAFMNGLGDGGEDKVNKFYKDNQAKTEADFLAITTAVEHAIDATIAMFGEQFADTTLFDAPNFLLLVCAVAFVEGALPTSALTADVIAKRGAGISLENAENTLPLLTSAVENNDIAGAYAGFVAGTKSSTQRSSTRKPRFNAIVNAISN